MSRYFTKDNDFYVEDGLTKASISYANDYNKVLNSTNDGFGIVQSDTDKIYADFEHKKKWAYGSFQDKQDDANPDVRSAKCYYLSSKSMVEGDEVIDQKGEVVSDKKSAKQIIADMLLTYESADTILNSIKSTQSACVSIYEGFSGKNRQAVGIYEQCLFARYDRLPAVP